MAAPVKPCRNSRCRDRHEGLGPLCPSCSLAWRFGVTMGWLAACGVGIIFGWLS